MQSLTYLLAILRGNDREEKINLLEKIQDTVSSEAIEILLAAIEDNTEYVKELIIETLGSFKDPRVIPALIKATRDNDPLVRTAALEQLANLDVDEKPELVRAFERCLRDSNHLVRTTAAESIGLLKIKSLSKSLETVLEDKSPLARAYAAFALGQIDSKSSKDLLTQMLGKEKNTRVRLGYYGALYLLGDEKYLNKIIRLLNSSVFEIRCASSSILDHLASPSNKITIINILNNALEKEEVEIARSIITEAISNIEKRLFSYT